MTANFGVPRNPCLDSTEEDAAEAIGTAAKLASQARGKISTDPALARKLIDSALEIDQENASAIRLKRSVTAPSWSETFTLRWEKLVNSINPFRDVALAFLVLFLALLILARFASALPSNWPKTGKARRKQLWVAGLSAAVAASFVLTFGVAATDRSPASGYWGVPIVGIPVAVLAVYWITGAMATRMRLSIEVRNSTGVSEVATGEVIALLGELGAEPPRGLEVPRGTDVTALDGTPIAGTPEGKIVAALTRVWQLISGLTPWRVRIDEETADLHSIVITRNGHTVTSVVADRDQLGLRHPIVRDVPAGDTGSQGAAKTTAGLPDLHRFAAAAILTTLAQHYEGFKGLCDVTDWRSLGLHYVATTDYASKANVNEQRAVLARALDLDPRNVAARVALRHSQDRESLDPRVLDEYMRWLLKTSNDLELSGDHVFALRLRVRMTLIASACNRQALPSADSAMSSGVGVAELVEAGDKLIRDLGRGKPPGGAKALVEAMKPSAAAAYLSLSGSAESETGRTAVHWLRHVHRFSPKGHYNYACLMARKHPSLSGTPATAPRSYREAVEHLRLASATPDLRAFMAKDPWLAELRKGRDYRKQFLEPRRTEFLSLDPLRKHRDDLSAADITTAKRLAETSKWRLSRYLKIDLLVAQRLVDVGGLAKEIPSYLRDFQVEITAALINEGTDSAAELRERLDAGEGADLATKVHADVYKRCQEQPRIKDLRKWLCPPP